MPKVKVAESKEVNAVVTGVYPNRVQIEVKDIESFKVVGEKLSVGAYLRISDSEDCAIVAVIQNFAIQKTENNGDRKYIIEGVPIGFIDANGIFSRGGNNIAIPPVGVTPATKDDISKIYGKIPQEKKFIFSSLSQDISIKVPVDGDKFFNKHVAIVGSTGCGKSCVISTLIQRATSLKESGYQGLNNSHIVIFDLHGEYKTAFPSGHQLDINNLILPYWLMNGEELEELLVESGENQAYNQTSLLRRIITRNKQKKTGQAKIFFDSPVHFSMKEVLNCIVNLTRETKDSKSPGKIMLKGAFKEFSNDDERFDYYFNQEFDFDESRQGSISKGTYNDGTLEKFVSRIRTKLSDARLSFLFSDQAEKLPFEDAIKNILGYNKNAEANVTVIDLSGIPFEVLSISVSLMSRILFEFGYYLKRKNGNVKRKTPLFMVYEEAHKYVPKMAGAKYSASRLSIERIAKEGRKYGVTLALVTQRPSEISETIFSQCNNFIAMRLTNPEDQSYVKRLLPDSLGPLTDTLPTLESGEAILIGDSVVMPSLVKMDRASPEPSSSDIEYLQEWKKPWLEVDFGKIIGDWGK